MRDAKETIELFWQTQNSRNYSELVPLFADDAVLEDPFFGRFEGRDAIAGFMAKMVEEMASRETHFTVKEIAGGRQPPLIMDHHPVASQRIASSRVAAL